MFIAGDIDLDEAINLARQNFEHIKNENSFDVSQIRFPQINQDIVTNQTRIYENVQKEQLVFYWPIQGLKAKNNTIVSVFSFIFGQGQGSRLYKRLVDEEKIATNVSVGADQLMEAGIFIVYIEPIDGKNEQCRQIVEQEIEKIITQGVTDQELTKVVKREKRLFFERMQSLMAFTYEWMSSYLASKDEFAVFRKLDEFDKVDSAQIQDFVSNYLDPFFMGQMQILPLPENKKEAWVKAKNYSDQVDMRILSNHVRETEVGTPKFVKSMPEPNKLDF
ncbi:MAG: insulinase family protein, partial [bacterium]